MEIRNGPNSTPIDLRMEVDGVIENTGKGYLDQHVENGTLTIRFRGTITAFEFDGQGSVAIEGESFRAQDVVGYDTRSSGGNAEVLPSPPEPGAHRPADGPDQHSSTEQPVSLDDRIDQAAGRDGRETVTVLDDGDAFKDLLSNVPFPIWSEVRGAVLDGTHRAGTVQSTILTAGGAPVVAVVGNRTDPFACEIRGNQNYINLAKDEHFRVEGMTWGRTQFAGTGDPFCRDMVFSDRHGKGHSAVGGKPARGRYQDCKIGHPETPDRYAGAFYGGGFVHIDAGTKLYCRDAYFLVTNTCTLYIDGNAGFRSGGKEVVEGSGIRPDDLGDGINVIEAGKLR